jgi:hypothetical protein
MTAETRFEEDRGEWEDAGWLATDANGKLGWISTDELLSFIAGMDWIEPAFLDSIVGQ